MDDSREWLTGDYVEALKAEFGVDSDEYRAVGIVNAALDSAQKKAELAGGRNDCKQAIVFMHSLYKDLSLDQQGTLAGGSGRGPMIAAAFAIEIIGDLLDTLVDNRAEGGGGT